MTDVFPQMTEGSCKVCGKELDHTKLTHCSNKCIFANIWNSESISGIPIETWDEDIEEPWI